jgi:phosphatidylethanolamine-binding protein (PEBP) family uncharacterized protein
MDVIYNGRKISNGEFLKVSETQKQPNIILKLPHDKLYTLVVHDPNAVGGDKIHWFIANIKHGDINSGTDVLPYTGPAPPPNTGKHNYIFRLYEKVFENIPELTEEDRHKYNEIKNKYNMQNPLYEIKFVSQNERGGRKRKTNKKRKNKKRKTKRKY